MQLRDEAEVLTARSQRVGRIDRVVIDPESRRVTHLVFKKGGLLKRDKVVPINFVEVTEEDRVVLKEGKEQDLKELPDFKETHQIPEENVDPFHRGPAGHARTVAWYYPWMVGWLPPIPTYPRPPEISAVKRSLASGTMGVQEKAKVFSRRGEYLGEVERVDREPAQNRVTYLLVSKGLVSKQRKMVPVQWVEWVREDSVWLSVGKNWFANLPPSSG